jgi:hypothetical protein
MHIAQFWSKMFVDWDDVGLKFLFLTLGLINSDYGDDYCAADKNLIFFVIGKVILKLSIIVVSISIFWMF